MTDDALKKAIGEATRVLCKANGVPDGDVIEREYREDAEALAKAGLLAVPTPAVDRAALVARVNEKLRSFLDWLDGHFDADEGNHLDNRILFEVDHPELWRRFLAATTALLARSAEHVPAATQRVTAEQVEQVTAFAYDEIEADWFRDLDDEDRAGWLRVFTSAFRRARIPVDGENRG